MQKFATRRVCLVSTALSISPASAHMRGGPEESLFHATTLWQRGGNLRTYLGLLTSPSGISSANTCHLDSWWIEKRRLGERVTAHLGQFCGQAFRGAQHYSASFIREPAGYALSNLFTDIESFDPPSTPAMEVRVTPLRTLSVKSMVEAEDCAIAFDRAGMRNKTL
jgi:porin